MRAKLSSYRIILSYVLFILLNMDAEIRKLITDNVDKLLDVLEAPQEDEARYSTKVRFSRYSKTHSYDIEKNIVSDRFDTSVEEEEEENEGEETFLDSQGEESEHQWNLDTIIKRPSNDLHENISKLRETVESLECKAENLNKIVEYLTKDPDVIQKLDEIKPFPLKGEKGVLRRMVNKLERRLSALENQPEEEEQEETPLPVLKRGKSKLKSLPILDMLVDPKETNSQLQYVYGNKTNGEIICILKSDIIRMINQLSEWQETNLEVANSLDELKNYIPSESLNSCVNKLNVMKKVIDIMTGGQFGEGEDIVFLNPNRVGDLEKELTNTGNRLQSLEEVMQTFGDFDYRIKRIKKKFTPYLRSIIFDEPLPGESEQRDIGLDALRERIQVIKSSMQNITDISTQLIYSQAERDNQLAKIREEIERLRYVKVDKEDVEDILTEKSDRKECDVRLNRKNFVDAVKRLAEFNNSCSLSSDGMETFWRDIIDDILRTCETKAKNIDLEEAKKEIKNNVKCMIEKLRNIRDTCTRRIEVSKNLDALVCVSCGRTIKGVSQYRKGESPSISCPAKIDEYKNQSRGDTLASMDAKHISKRYCGSSHTITTPEQRLEREIISD